MRKWGFMLIICAWCVGGEGEEKSIQEVIREDKRALRTGERMLIRSLVAYVADEAIKAADELTQTIDETLEGTLEPRLIRIPTYPSKPTRLAPPRAPETGKPRQPSPQPPKPAPPQPPKTPPVASQ
jgi:hypothetical protein